MKVSLIKASAPGYYKQYKQERGGPPQNIFALAAATPPHVHFDLIDETANMKVKYNTDSDLISISMSTPDALHAYNHAKEFRRRGKTVVFSGLHPTFLPDEALKHGDAVIIGEQEGVWEELLEDFETGTLKRKYQNDEPVDLSTLNPYPNCVPKRIYNDLWSVVVSRGCPFKCSFCLVNKFFDRIRYRPVENVIDEIRNAGTNWFELHADNLTHDRDYAMELFTALKPLNINWVGETTIRLAEDQELLEAAAASGCTYLLVGLETPSQSALKNISKGFVHPEQAKEYVSRLHEHNIIVDSSMLFGFDEHDTDIFKRALEFTEYVEIDICDPIISIPFPGSTLFKNLEAEGRILTYDWSLYDGGHAVFQPAQMTPEELEKGQEWFMYNYYSPVRAMKRKARQIKNVGLTNSTFITFG